MARQGIVEHRLTWKEKNGAKRAKDVRKTKDTNVHKIKLHPRHKHQANGSSKKDA